MRRNLSRLGRRNSLGFERLELRSLLAGDVTAAVVNGALKIKGDDADNAVQIAPGTSANQFVITGLNGTTINGGGSATLSGVTGLIASNLEGGNDTLTIAGVTTPRGVAVYDYEGANTLNITGATTINGDLYVYSAGGVATINLTGTNITSNLLAVTGNAADQVTLTGVNVGKTTTISTGLGDDTISMTGGSQTGPLTINSTSPLAPFASRLFRRPITDNDTVTINATTVNGSEAVNLGEGNDNLTITGGTVSGPVGLNGGGGDDTITATGAAWNGRNNLVAAGDGTNTVNLGAANAALTLAGNLLVTGGRGVDNINLTNVTAAAVSVNTFGGNDKVSVTDSVFSGNSLFWLGDGDDTLLLVNTKFNGQTNDLLGGQGNDTLTKSDPGNVFAVAPTIKDFETQN